MKSLLITSLVMVLCLSSYGQDLKFIELWPDEVPGEVEAKSPAVISDNKKGDVVRIEKVTNPALVVYEAEPSKRNGAAVIICPGGGYNILAVDKEGYEIAEWLNSIGYTAFVLQYRVPQKKEGALQDAQRAIRYVRSNSEKYHIDENKIGILGFSAGGSLSALASTLYNEKTYENIDKVDAASARPDFAVLIYPAYLDQGPDNTLTPELKVNENTPPMFLFVAFDDKRFVNGSLVMGSALRVAGVPFELHILPEGGHGFGMRPGKRAAETWPQQCEVWMSDLLFNVSSN
jgi:acetyl esterase/lipase